MSFSTNLSHLGYTGINDWEILFIYWQDRHVIYLFALKSS